MIAASKRAVAGTDGAPAALYALPGSARPLDTHERARADWTLMVAHDLRQPLSTIALCTELLEQARRDGHPPDARVLARVCRAVESLERMTSDLVDATALDAGRFTVEPVAIEIAPVVRAAIDHLPAVSARCEVRVDPRADVVVRADPVRLEQVLGNLVTNAVKYGEPGTRIALDITRSGDDVCVTVANRGAGIPMHELSRLFDRFERGSAARTRARGLGLGLYIARQLVEAHGGRIWASCTPDELTRFQFTLPIEPRRDFDEPASQGEEDGRVIGVRMGPR